MKAIVITEPGEPSVLQVQERPMPFCGLGEVLIQVKAAGVNRPDVAQRQGLYPPPPGASLDIPGLEVSGTILECGAQVDRWSKGDRVCALLTGGGYAEFVAVPAGQCLPIPENLSFEEAASLPETVFTVWHNVFQRAGLTSCETLLVHGGSSGIGITAIQIAAAKGAKVVVTVGTEEKGLKCMELGASGYVNYKELDFEAALLEEGVDVVLDMVGGSYFDKNLNILRPDGRLVYINSMQGNLVKLNIARMMQKRITISGSTLRSRDTEFKSALAAEVEQHVWPLLVNGQFKPVIYRTFPMAEAGQAHALLESSSHTGKIVLVNT
jgi:putative PIG3 family NAD(P)H quinone oxidoreductase